MAPPIAYKIRRDIPASGVRRLFQDIGFNDWFSASDVRWYLRHALYVVSAWHGERCVGIAVLAGDGRINVWLDTLLVDERHQRRGIGSRLMRYVVAEIDRLKPYHVAVDVFERRTERFYARFGFRPNKGTWLLEHGPTATRLRKTARAARAALRAL